VGHFAKHSSRGPGQALVEFAFILPVMLILVLGMIEVGRAFVFGVAVQDGAREAARLAANARLNPSLAGFSTLTGTYTTDAPILQRFIDGSSPALSGCTIPPTATAPLPLTCGGGTWILTLTITPTSGSSASSFSNLSSLEYLNGGTVEVKANGSVALLSGFATGWAGMSLYQIGVQGEATMVVM
jgi:Flp pilus assembly protein TadG